MPARMMSRALVISAISASRIASVPSSTTVAPAAARAASMGGVPSGTTVTSTPFARSRSIPGSSNCSESVTVTVRGSGAPIDPPGVGVAGARLAPPAESSVACGGLRQPDRPFVPR